MDVPNPSINSTESLLSALQTPNSWITTDAAGCISADTISHGQPNTPSLISHGQPNTLSQLSHGQPNTLSQLSHGQPNTLSQLSHGQPNTSNVNDNRTVITNTTRNISESYDDIAGRPLLVSWLEKSLQPETENKAIAMDHSYRGVGLDFETKSLENENCDGHKVACEFDSKYPTFGGNSSSDVVQGAVISKSLPFGANYFSGPSQPQEANIRYTKQIGSENTFNMPLYTSASESNIGITVDNNSSVVSIQSGLYPATRTSESNLGATVDNNSSVVSIQSGLYPATRTNESNLGATVDNNSSVVSIQSGLYPATRTNESNLGATVDNNSSVVSIQSSLYPGIVTSAPLLYCNNNVPSNVNDDYKSDLNQGQYTVGKQPIAAISDSTEAILTVPALFDEHCIEQTTAGSVGHGALMCGGCGQSFVTICQLHAHLYCHGNGGSYHYDHYTRTAFPKYDTVCCAIQTDDRRFSSGNVKTESSGEKAPETNFITVSPLLNFITVSPLSTSENEMNASPTMDIPKDDSRNEKISEKISDTMVGNFNKDADTGKENVDLVDNVTINEETATKTHERDVDERREAKYQTVTGVEDECSEHSNESGMEDGCYEHSNESKPSSNDVDESRNNNKFKLTPRYKGRFIKRSHISRTWSGFAERKKDKSVEKDKSGEKMDAVEVHTSKKRVRHSRQKVSGMTDDKTADPDYDVEADLEEESRIKKQRPKQTGVLVKREGSATDDTKHDVKFGRNVEHACLYCNVIFTAEKYLNTHILRHEGKYPCDVCFVSFPDINHYIDHVCKGGGKMNKKIMIYYCKYCEESFSELVGLKGHICEGKEGTKMLVRIKICPGKRIEEEISVAKYSPPLTPKIEGGGLHCNICSTLCKNVSNLYCHYMMHKFPHRCADCCLYFSDELEKNTHEIICSGNDVLQCQICKKSYKNKSSYVVHMRLHNGKRDFQCELCGHSFACMNYLRNHMRLQRCQLNERERTFKCDLCNKKFFDRNTLRGHVRVVHSDERKMICEICGSTFKYGSALKKHILSHEPSRPVLQCKTCGATFKAIECLKRHEKRHVQQCSLECSTCGKKFHERWNLKAHVRQHTGEKPYSCDVCGKAFTHNVSRKHHMHTHHGLSGQSS